MKKLKKAGIILLSVIACIGILYAVFWGVLWYEVANSGNPDDIKVGESQLLTPRGEYMYKVFDNYVMYGGGVDDFSLEYHSTGDTDYPPYADGEVLVAGTFEEVCKDGNSFAIHNIIVSPKEDTNDTGERIVSSNGAEFAVNEESYYILNADNDKLLEFESKDDFTNYCNHKGLNFNNWEQNLQKK